MIQGTGIFIPPSSFLPGELIAPKGTRIPFNQAAAPLGWTTDTASTLTDCTSTLRAASGGTTGGSAVWSGWQFGGTRNANAVTLSVANMPSHTHTVNDPTHAHGPSDGANFLLKGNGNQWQDGINTVAYSGQQSGSSTVNAAGANVGVGNAGSGSSFTPTIPAPSVKYTDLIICVRQS